ncbi:MAG: CopG family antitoxin [Anaerolineales bacterium]|nr:CopG family antitoxin [Anaerolineales bacterium]
MKKGKSSISKAQSYREMGEFWDTHDLSDYWDQTHPVEFEIDIQSEIMYYPLEVTLSDKMRSVAEQRGVSPETLINLWVQEKLLQEMASS